MQTTTPELSPVDLQLLGLLQKDASLTTAELAEKVGLSQSPCWRRICRLEEAGYIKKRVALLDPEKLGLGVVVFTSVNLASHHGSALSEFESQVARFPEVVECYTMTGTMDYMLKIVCKDVHHYENFARKYLAQVSNIREMHSNVAITRIKDTTELPVGER
ncbi:Lrp/AsnC family transcriptional regulator [Gilvimarinus sp. F26214L]|uniref:Lrp/AsnC family transcriptional regulator n=1 Tax=Gilvimarinus sp. DZF01 TaxID=3461371 RepID=UPI004045E7AD